MTVSLADLSPTQIKDIEASYSTALTSWMVRIAPMCVRHDSRSATALNSRLVPTSVSAEIGAARRCEVESGATRIVESGLDVIGRYYRSLSLTDFYIGLLFFILYRRNAQIY